MSRSSCRAVAASTVVALALVVLAAPALAHETRQVGSYQLAVGWTHEPTYVGVENGVQIFIHDAAGNPVDDLGNPTSLKVAAIYGHQTSAPLDLEPSWDPDTGLGTHGEWDAALTPTQPGVYTFHLTGSINGQPVDEKFTSSDTTFDSVADPLAIEFPTQTPTVEALAQAQTRAEPRIAAAQAAAHSAQSSVDTAEVLAIVALVVAVVAGGAALFVSLRRRPPS